jgi:hypothetical protein
VFAILLKLLRHLGGLFGLYAKGIIFAADNVRHIRHIGIAVFMFCATWVYAILAKLLLLILDQPVPAAAAGPDSIGFNVDNYPLLGFMTGIIIIIISWIMDVGREMREEQDLTV